MGCRDPADTEFDSMDLYSRVKLRAAGGRRHSVHNDTFAAKDDKLVNAGLKKSMAYIGQYGFSVNFAANPENRRRINAIAVDSSRLTSLIAAAEEETSAWRNDKKDLSDQCANTRAFQQLDEGTAIEMLYKLRKGRTKHVSFQLDIGDLVWGKIQSHPWWPGQIYYEALASPSVFSTKKEGCVLVAFYGDYTYGWLNARNLIPFDIHYAAKSKQTNEQLFLRAVKEATYEFLRRAALGLVCHCGNPSNFRPTEVEGLFEVDVKGYIPGGTYSAKQIEKARDEFQPDETLCFIKQLAMAPRKYESQNICSMKNLVKVFAYQIAAVHEFDETYSQAFKVQQRSSEDPKSLKDALQGMFEIDIEGYISGGIYSAKQIEKARDEFQPDETLPFSKQLEVGLKKNVPQNLYSMKNLAKDLDYRRASFDEFDEPYSQVFQVPQTSFETPSVSEDALQAPLDGLLAAKAPEKKTSTQATGANHLQKKDDILVPNRELNVSCGRFSDQVSGDPQTQIRSEIYKGLGSEGQYDKPLQKQLRSDVPLNAGNKHNISGCQENLSMKKVRLNEVKCLARIGGNHKLLEIQSRERTGIRASSSIKLEKNPEMETNSLRSYAEPTMLVIKFPPRTILPSISELRAKFVTFGPFDESSIRFFWKSSTCQIVFPHKTNAEAAYHHAIRCRTMFSSEVSYDLQALSVAASELSKSTESLKYLLEEGHKEFQPQTLLSSDEYFNEVKPTFQQLHLLQENIKINSRLEDFQEEESNCPNSFAAHSLASVEDMYQHIHPLSSLSTFPLYSTMPYTNEQIGINDFVDTINKKHSQVEANSDHGASTSTNRVDVYQQLINLLTSCSAIVSNSQTNLS